MDASDRPEEGFALLLALWSMAVLALLLAPVLRGGQTEANLAYSSRQQAQLQEAADGAIFETIWHLLDGGGDFWIAGTSVYIVDEFGTPVEVDVIDDRGKFDINQSSQVELAALFSRVGADEASASQVAGAIDEWRTPMPTEGYERNRKEAFYKAKGFLWGPPGEDFQRLDELKLVAGMTPDLYSASVPYLTLALEQGPWVQYASGVVLAALADAERESGRGIVVADKWGPIVLQIHAHARGHSGSSFTRSALVRLDGREEGPAWKFRILDWGTTTEAG
jgi:general secretion pathway protein K